MRLTRIIAIGVIAASIATSANTWVNAQTLRTAGPPAEYPPETFKGNQYVDSRGCIYIRAGVDGYTTWVPRVTRDRKVVCGYKPSLSASERTAAAPPQQRPGVEQITIAPPAAAPETSPATAQPDTAPSTRTAAVVPAAPKQPLAGVIGGSGPSPSPGPKPTVYQNPTPPKAKTKAPAPTPKPTVQAAPVPTPRTPSAGPAPTVIAGPSTVSQKPVTAPTVQTAAAPTNTTVRCSNASDFSQQYINDGSRYPVRCGPQAKPPYPAGAYQYSANGGAVTSGTRVVPRHVYDNRQNTQNVTVPQGYTTVWKDGRLNPYRAERTLAPYQPRQGVSMPKGYRLAWSDDRLNTQRGGSAAGDSQTGQIWSETVPRKLNKVPTDRRVVQNPNPQNPGLPRARAPTRSETKQATAATQQPARVQPSGKRRYIRVATYNTDAEARASAQSLVRKTGLTVRLGTLTRKGKTYRVVMAGPYTTDAGASSAMSKVRGAGYSGARLSK